MPTPTTKPRAAAVAQATAVIDAFPALYAAALLQRPARQARPARAPATTTATRALADDWLALLHAAQRRLHAGLAAPGRRRRRATSAPLRALFADAAAPRRLAGSAGARAARARTRRVAGGARRAPRACGASTRWIIPRNHRVEEALAAASDARRPRRRSSACSPRCAGPSTSDRGCARYAEPAPARGHGRLPDLLRHLIWVLLVGRAGLEPATKGL